MTATVRHTAAIGAMTAAVRHAAAIGAMTATTIGAMTTTISDATPATITVTATAVTTSHTVRAAVETAVTFVAVTRVAVMLASARATISSPEAMIIATVVVSIMGTVAIMEAMKPFAPVAIMIIEMMEAIAVEAITTKPSALEAVESVMDDDGTIEIKRTVEPWMCEIEVVPGARADKHAVHKPVGPVITVGSAAKRIRWIKTVGAHWRSVVNAVTWADLNTDGNLCL